MTADVFSLVAQLSAEQPGPVTSATLGRVVFGDLAVAARLLCDLQASISTC